MAAAAFGFPQHAKAETLEGALQKAYRSNPTLTGARSGQRVIDENVPIQKSEGRPRASAGAELTQLLICPICLPNRNVQLDAGLSLPIYSGGAVSHGIEAAEVRVEAGQANLRAIELSIFSQVVAAYTSVISAREIVSLNQSNLDLLGVNLRGTIRRFEAGDLTRTDIAQSETRLAIAYADLQQAEANLAAAHENYIALVGETPGDLAPPPPLPPLPVSFDDAVAIALEENPEIAAAEHDRRAASLDVRVSKAAVMPTLSAFARGNYTHYLDSVRGSDSVRLDEAGKEASVGLAMRLPLYQGGGPAARVRQDQARESQLLERIVEIERRVIAQVRSSFVRWQSALRTIEAATAAVAAADLSLRGVQAENSVGTRTIIELLNAQQEARNARIRLIVADQDAYVEAFSLLATMGRAEAEDLNLDGPLYDPATNYDRVRGKILDSDYDPRPEPVAGRTVDSLPRMQNYPRFEEVLNDEINR